jgi:hypothetical protein
MPFPRYGTIVHPQLDEIIHHRLCRGSAGPSVPPDLDLGECQEVVCCS